VFVYLTQRLRAGVTCQNQLLSDLAFISVLSGNDYLPKLRGFNLERVWDAYLDARAKNLFAPEVPLYGTQRAARSENSLPWANHFCSLLDSSTRTINAEFLAHLLQPKYQTTSVPEVRASDQLHMCSGGYRYVTFIIAIAIAILSLMKL
jgi:hypothetical protein